MEEIKSNPKNIIFATLTFDLAYLGFSMILGYRHIGFI
jgi:hypothetical protein